MFKPGNRVKLNRTSGHTLDYLQERGFQLSGTYTVIEALTFVTITSVVAIILVSHNSLSYAPRLEQYIGHYAAWEPDYMTPTGRRIRKIIYSLMRS